jgi:hypothetical protein
MATADFTIVTEARRLTNSEPGTNLSADFPSIYPELDVCGNVAMVKSNSNVSTNYKEFCGQKLTTELYRLSARVTNVLESLPQYTPGADQLAKSYIFDNMNSILAMVLGGVLAPGFIARGPSYILPFPGTNDPEVIISGNWSEVVDVCQGDTGIKFNFSASQFAFTSDCRKFQRHSISLSGFKGLDYGPGVDAFLGHSVSNVPVGALAADTINVTDVGQIAALEANYTGIYNNMGGQTLTYGV